MASCFGIQRAPGVKPVTVRPVGEHDRHGQRCPVRLRLGDGPAFFQQHFAKFPLALPHLWSGTAVSRLVLDERKMRGLRTEVQPGARVFSGVDLHQLWPDHAVGDRRLILWLMMAFSIVFPACFFRYARSLWMAMDLFWDPPPDEETPTRQDVEE